MYDPAIGRFLNEDFIGFDGDGSNQLRYVGNSPFNATDPTGLAAEPRQPRNDDFPLGHPGRIVNLDFERLPTWWGINSNNMGPGPHDPNLYVGAARRDLHVRDMMDFFFNMANGRFTLYVLDDHRLNAELRRTDYVKNRFSELTTLLETRAAKGQSIGAGHTSGTRVADVAAFIKEMPKNIAQGLLSVTEKVLRVKQDFPLLNFLGSYSLRLDYDNVDICAGTADVIATAVNHTTWGSLTRIPGTSVSVINTKADFVQIYEWREQVRFKPWIPRPHDPLEPPRLGTPNNPFGMT